MNPTPYKNIFRLLLLIALRLVECKWVRLRSRTVPRIQAQVLQILLRQNHSTFLMQKLLTQLLLLVLLAMVISLIFLLTSHKKPL